MRVVAAAGLVILVAALLIVALDRRTPEHRREVAERLDHEGRPGLLELSLADSGSGRHRDGRHARRAGRAHVPGRIADRPAPLGLQPQALGGKEQQVRRGLGVLDRAAVDDVRRLGELEGAPRTPSPARAGSTSR